MRPTELSAVHFRASSAAAKEASRNIIQGAGRPDVNTYHGIAIMKLGEAMVELSEGLLELSNGLRATYLLIEQKSRNS